MQINPSSKTSQVVYTQLTRRECRLRKTSFARVTTRKNANNQFSMSVTDDVTFRQVCFLLTAFKLRPVSILITILFHQNVDGIYHRRRYIVKTERFIGERTNIKSLTSSYIPVWHECKRGNLLLVRSFVQFNSKYKIIPTLLEICSYNYRM